jgi:hypothetical protein
MGALVGVKVQYGRVEVVNDQIDGTGGTINREKGNGISKVN